RVPSAERDVDRRRVDPWRRLLIADRVSRLVDALRTEGERESLERDRPRVADAVAAADAQLRSRADGHPGSVRLSRDGENRWLITRRWNRTRSLRTSSISLKRSSSSRRRPRSACGRFWSPR